MGLKSPVGLKPSMSRHLHTLVLGFSLVSLLCVPGPSWAAYSNSYIPNIRPQIDLNLFMSILKYLMELSLVICLA